MTRKIIIHSPSVKDGATIFSATLDCGLKSWKQRLIIRGAGDHASWLDNTGDVWATLFLFKMMEYGGEFHLCGSISASLLQGIDRFVHAWTKLSPEHCRPIRLLADDIEDDNQRPLLRPALACFSGGLDACFTAYRHRKGLAGPQNQQLEACLLIRGADIRLDREKEWLGAESSARCLVEDLGIPHFYTVETNFREMHCPYGQAYFTMLAACMRLFGRKYGHLMLGSDDPVHWFIYPWGNNPVTNHMLSSHGCEIITDGVEFTRTEKAAVVAQWPLALKMMRCCYSGPDLSCNCGHCDKCRRTRLNFMAVGVNDLPCMPPTAPDEELLPDVLNETEHQELSLLVDYLDKNPLVPTPLWEKRLRHKLGKPIHMRSEPMPLWKRLCSWRKIVSGHLKLFRARKQVKKYWLATKRDDSKPLDKVMQELRRFVSSGRAFPVRSLIYYYFYFRLQYQGSDASQFVFESEWLHDFIPLVQAAGEEREILENKDSCLEVLARHGIAVPRKWGLLQAEQGKAYVYNDQSGQRIPLQQLLAEQHILFVKPLDGMQGIGCLKLENLNEDGLIVNGNKRTWDAFADSLSAPLLVQEYVQQHPDVAALHPQSLNTLRLVTMRTSTGRFHHVTCMQRMGVGEMHLDNLCQGGMAVGVTDDGLYRSWAYYNNDPIREAVRVHPDTGVVFAGRPLPFFREAIELACKAHALFPRMHSVGWDIAITPKGPLIIEANVKWGFMTIQMVNKGLRPVLENELRPAARALSYVSSFKRANQAEKQHKASHPQEGERL